MRDRLMPAISDWSMSLNAGLFIASVLLMFYARGTSFIPTTELEKCALCAAALIGLLIAVKFVRFCIANPKDEKGNRVAIWAVVIFAPIFLVFMWWLILVHAFSYWFTLSVGESVNEIQIGVTEYNRHKWGICEYRLKTTAIRESNFAHICISKEFYQALPREAAQPFKLIGKRSLIGYAVDDVAKAEPSITMPSGVQINVIVEGAGASPKTKDTTKFKLLSNPVSGYSNYSKQLDQVKSWSFKTMPPKMQAILETMKVGGKSIVQCPTLADCGLKIEGQPQLETQPFILEIELISSSVEVS